MWRNGVKSCLVTILYFLITKQDLIPFVPTDNKPSGMISYPGAPPLLALYLRQAA
jgi:hypothetical protein